MVTILGLPFHGCTKDRPPAESAKPRPVAHVQTPNPATPIPPPASATSDVEDWIISAPEVLAPETITLGGRHQKAPSGTKWIVVSLTLASKTNRPDSSTINTGSIFLMAGPTSRGEYAGIADTASLKNAAFITPNVVVGDEGFIMLRERNGVSLALGKKDKVPYVQLPINGKSIQLLIAFSVSGDAGGRYTLHFGNTSLGVGVSEAKPGDPGIAR